MSRSRRFSAGKSLPETIAAVRMNVKHCYVGKSWLPDIATRNLSLHVRFGSNNSRSHYDNHRPSQSNIIYV